MNPLQVINYGRSILKAARLEVRKTACRIGVGLASSFAL